MQHGDHPVYVCAGIVKSERRSHGACYAESSEYGLSAMMTRYDGNTFFV